jgi:hypothetical protein
MSDYIVDYMSKTMINDYGRDEDRVVVTSKHNLLEGWVLYENGSRPSPCTRKSMTSEWKSAANLS